jgi:hypothetical protein
VRRYADVYNIDTGLAILGFKIDNFPIDMWTVFGMGMAFRIVAYVFLEILHRDKRK